MNKTPQAEFTSLKQFQKPIFRGLSAPAESSQRHANDCISSARGKGKGRGAGASIFREACVYIFPSTSFPKNPATPCFRSQAQKNPRLTGFLIRLDGEFNNSQKRDAECVV